MLRRSNVKHTIESKNKNIKSFKDFNYEPTTYVFVGDIMQHPQQLQFESTRGFSYEGVFDEVKPILDQGDYVIGNLETLLSNDFSMPGFREGKFRVPVEFGHALARAGFTHLCCMNNHCYDFGVKGLKESVKLIKKCGMTPITGKSSIENLDVLNVCTHFNGSGRFSKEEIQSNILNDTVLSDRMKLCFIHWGEQYNLSPVPEQLDINASLINYGYTLIVGSGPHSTNETVMNNGILTAYSLGDFLSAHQKKNTTNEGKILVVKILNKKIVDYKEYNTETVQEEYGKSVIKVK